MPELIAAHAGWARGEQPTTVLLDLKVTRVHDNGLSEVFVQRVVRIEDETGADEEKWPVGAVHGQLIGNVAPQSGIRSEQS